MILLESGQELAGVAALDSYSDFADNKYVLRVVRYQHPGQYGLKIFLKEDYLKAKAKNLL